MYRNINKKATQTLVPFLTPCQLTVPSPLDFDLPRNDRWDAVSSAGSKSSASHLDATKYTVSHDDSSEVTEQTRITTPGSIDNNRHLHGGPCRGPMLGSDNQGQDLYDLHPLEGANDRLAHTVSNARVLFSVQSITTDGMDDASASDFTGADADRDHLAIQPQQCIGPGRYNERSTHSNQGPDRNLSSSLEVDASWERPEESTSEARKVIQRVERLGALQDPTTTRNLQVANTRPRGTRVASGPFTADTDELGHAAYPGLTNIEPAQTEAGSRVLPSSASASRQTRLNESDGMIHRLNPRAGNIHFDIDADSFLRAGIGEDDVAYITREAREVTSQFNARELGISFTYAPGAGPKVFSIRCDLALPKRILAAAFFPCDKRERRQVRISTRAIVPSPDGSFLEFMNNILSHEFAHILGLRHWNAGSKETAEKSLLWDGTVDEARDTIMNTNVHPSLLQFSNEDYRVIQELYSLPNGTVMFDGRVGRMIVDVDPYVGQVVL